MSLGLVGRKVGMTRIFTDDGDAVPVTVLDVRGQPRDADQDPGNGRLRRRAGRVRQAPRHAREKALAGHFAKAGVEAGERAARIPRRRRRRSPTSRSAAKIGVDMFKVGQKVDVTAPRWARASPASSSATTSPRTARPTATRSRTTPRDRSAWRRTRAACSPASAWRATWATSGAPRRGSKSCASTPSASCCWSRARCPAPRAAHVVVRPAVKAQDRRRRREPDDGTQAHQRQGPGAATVAATDALFGRDYNEALVHQVVVAYQANGRAARARRRAAAKSATRTKKPGARRAPAARAPA